METDYDNFAVIYSCRLRDFGTAVQHSVWVMSRQPAYPLSTNDALWRDVKRVGLEALTMGFPDYATGRKMAQEENFDVIK